jgi:hypothetical protein
MYIRERGCGLDATGSGEDRVVVRSCEYSDKISGSIRLMSATKVVWLVW